MHGAIFTELKQFAISAFGETIWDTLLAESHLSHRVYQSFGNYPDAEVFAIVTTASRISGKTIPELLDSFGEYLAGGLLRAYKPVIKAEWKTMDVLLHTEQVVHKLVRIQNPSAMPPRLEFTKIGDNKLSLIYRSSRKLCPLAKGLARGIGNHYHELVEHEESQCMHSGALFCKMSFTISPKPTEEENTSAAE